MQDQSNDCWDGFHIKRYENGDVYSGYFIHGEKSGNGKLEQINGTNYEGYWLKDKKLEGTERYSNGDIYTGKFFLGARYG